LIARSYNIVMPVIVDIAELKKLTGQEVGVSGWFEMSQDRIRQFADTTGDHQWIHVDPDRARAESPYGATIAHGFLTLSLISQMMAQAVQIDERKIGINYGFNRVRFPAPVRAGTRVRGRFTLQAMQEIEGGAQFTWAVTVEAEGTPKPVVVAEWLTRHYR
jgi:acyl dehydratase